MPNSLHLIAYRRLRTLLQTLTFGVSLGFRIYFAAAVILFTTSASYVMLYLFQQRQASITEEVLNVRLTSMESAQKIKELVVAYDNSIFRFAATRSEFDLQMTKDLRKDAMMELDRLRTLTNNIYINSRLVELRSRLGSYFREAGNLVEFARANKLPASASLFQAASWARDQGTQREELSLLSTAGEQRLQRVFALCDELTTYNQAQLASARTEIAQIIQESRNWGKIILAASFFVVLLVSMALAVSLIGPIRILMSGVNKVESGQLDIELPITSATEIGKLTAAFNRMARTIQGQRERLLRETITDNLTGAYNQRHFGKRLAQEFDRTRRTGEPLSLMMIDVDHFKGYNDTMGHELGNVVLRKISQAIQENLRNVDLLFRYGGDEFAAILPNADPAEAGVIADRLTEVIRTCRFPGTEKDNHLKLTLSIGGASFPRNAQSVEDLVAKADAALYAAKEGGRDCFRWCIEETAAA